MAPIKIPMIKLSSELVKEIAKIAAVAAGASAGTYLIMKVAEKKKKEVTSAELEQLQKEVFELYSKGIIPEDSFSRINTALEALKKNQ